MATIVYSKVALSGNAGVGKSALLSRFASDEFIESYTPTIGLDYRFHQIDYNGEKRWLQIFDTAGQESYRQITNAFYTSSDGVILVFDLTNRESFKSINDWFAEARKHAGDDLKILLVGNKCDLESTREVTREEAQKLADSLNIPYVETSAKDSINAHQAFNDFTAQLSSKSYHSTQESSDVLVKSTVESLAATRKIKVVLLGDSGVGKTSLMTRLTTNRFDPEIAKTIGVDFSSYRLVQNGTTSRLQIWDLSGHERFRALLSHYFRDADAALLVFDITNEGSFKSISEWHQNFTQEHRDDTRLVLIGNKTDLVEERAIDHKKAQALAHSLKIPYIETSAMDSTNVCEAFRSLVEKPQPTQTSASSARIEKGYPTDQSYVESPVQDPSDGQIVKLVLIGDSGVGKSSLIKRFCHHIFDSNFMPTIGIDFMIQVIQHDGVRVKLQIWDTAGQERFRSITSSYYRSAHGIIIVFDVTCQESYDHVDTWLEEIKKYAHDDLKKLLVGNKGDSIKERVIHQEVAQELADRLKIPYMETSAKTPDNVDQIFQRIVRDIIPNPSWRGSDRPIIRAGYEPRPTRTSSSLC